MQPQWGVGKNAETLFRPGCQYSGGHRDPQGPQDPVRHWLPVLRGDLRTLLRPRFPAIDPRV